MLFPPYLRSAMVRFPFEENLTRLDFLKWPKICYFWIHFRGLEHYSVTTLQVVASGSPLLRITKSG